LQTIQLPALIEAVDQHSKETDFPRAYRRRQIGATPRESGSSKSNIRRTSSRTALRADHGICEDRFVAPKAEVRRCR
jgi:hypothetical protein